MNKTVLITGATGFIGYHLVERVLAEGCDVRVLVLPDDPKRRSLDSLKMEIVEGDLRDEKAVARACDGVDIVFHCAAIVSDWASESLYWHVNVEGTRTICESAVKNNVDRFVHLSSNDVFGLDESQVINENHTYQPWNEPYPDTKIEAEKICWEFYENQHLPVSMAYPCWVYGEGDETFVPELVEAIEDRTLIFWRDEVNVWPSYVKNVVDLLWTLATDENAVGNGYFVHDGDMMTFREFTNYFAHALDLKPIDRQIPYYIAMSVAEIMEWTWEALGWEERPLLTTYAVKNLGSQLRFSIGKARNELDWNPVVSLSEGLERTVDWLRKKRTTNTPHD